MTAESIIFPDFFHETQNGSLFTNESLKNRFCLVFCLVSVASKKDQKLIWLYKDLFDDLCSQFPSAMDQITFVGITSDTPSVLKNFQSNPFDFFPLLSCSDKRVFERMQALTRFSLFNIKASEPSRKAFLLNPDHAVLWTWEKGELPSMETILSFLSFPP